MKKIQTLAALTLCVVPALAQQPAWPEITSTMRPWCYNWWMGSAVDEAALLALMRGGHLAGAALDVFEREPLPKDSPMWECPRLLITTHVAGNMTLKYTVDRIVALFLEDLGNFCAGRLLAHLVDREKGY